MRQVETLLDGPKRMNFGGEGNWGEGGQGEKGGT